MMGLRASLMLLPTARARARSSSLAEYRLRDPVMTVELFAAQYDVTVGLRARIAGKTRKFKGEL